LPAGLSVTVREDETYRYLFAMNFTQEPQQMACPAGTWLKLDSSETVAPLIRLQAYQVSVMRQAK